MKAIDQIRQSYVTEEELAELLNVDTKRIRDLRSHHVQGKHKFINHIKPSSKCVLYSIDDILGWLYCQDRCLFGIAKEGGEEDGC